MVVSRRTQQLFIWLCIVLVGTVYSVAWFAPAIGLLGKDGANLIGARSLVSGHGYLAENLPHPVPLFTYPPLFPALLGLFSFISMNPQWLKLLPLVCTAGWLLLTLRLLRKLGATGFTAFFLVAASAASPATISFSTGLLTESLFALLMTAALLTMIEGRRPLGAGLLAGLAAVTSGAGVPLIVAGIFTHLVRKRVNGAVWFTLGAMIPAAPWIGWAAAHGLGSYLASSCILTNGLAAGDRFRVLGANLFSLIAAPYFLLTGIVNTLASLVTLSLVIWSLFVRRQLVPDLFLLFYCITLSLWVEPPQLSLAPVLPLVLWLVWRIAQNRWSGESLAAIAILTLGIQITLDAMRIPEARRSGTFPVLAKATDDWHQVQRLSSFIRAEVPFDSVVLANLDSAIYLTADRRSTPPLAPDNYDLYYAPNRRRIAPFQLAQSIRESQAAFIVVMPDNGLARSAGFRDTVLALERSGIVDPVPVSGLDSGYSLWRIRRQ